MKEELHTTHSEKDGARDAFDAAGLPLRVVWGDIDAYGGRSHYEEGIAYRLEIDGVEAGDYGVAELKSGQTALSMRARANGIIWETSGNWRRIYARKTRR